MIIPITPGIAAWRARAGRPTATADGPQAPRGMRQVIPVFIGWFLVSVALNTIGLVPPGCHPVLSATAEGMITMALGAIGLSTRPRDIRRAGFRPLALGAILWVLVAASSLSLQVLTGTHV